MPITNLRSVFRSRNATSTTKRRAALASHFKDRTFDSDSTPISPTMKALKLAQLGGLPQITLAGSKITLVTYNLEQPGERTGVLVKTAGHKLFELGSIQLQALSGSVCLMGAEDIPLLVLAPYTTMDPQDFTTQIQLLGSDSQLTFSTLNSWQNLAEATSSGFKHPILPSNEIEILTHHAMRISPSMDKMELALRLVVKNALMRGVYRMLVDDSYEFRSYI